MTKKMHIHVEEKFTQKDQSVPYPEIKTKETKTLQKFFLLVLEAVIFSLKHRSLINWNKLIEV